MASPDGGDYVVGLIVAVVISLIITGPLFAGLGLLITGSMIQGIGAGLVGFTLSVIIITAIIWYLVGK